MNTSERESMRPANVALRCRAALPVVDAFDVYAGDEAHAFGLGIQHRMTKEAAKIVGGFPRLCHPAYCLVLLDVKLRETAE